MSTRAYRGVGFNVSDGDNEKTIATLLADLNKAKATGGLTARQADAMIDIMPGFLRTMARERETLATQIKTDAEGDYVSQADIHEHLKIMVSVLGSMIGSVIMTLIPCGSYEGRPVCPTCTDRRDDTLACIMHNLFRMVQDSLKEPPQFVGVPDEKAPQAKVVNCHGDKLDS